MPFQKQDYVDHKLDQFTEMIMSHKIKTGDLKSSLQTFKLQPSPTHTKRLSQELPVNHEKLKLDLVKM